MILLPESPDWSSTVIIYQRTLDDHLYLVIWCLDLFLEALSFDFWNLHPMFGLSTPHCLRVGLSTPHCLRVGLPNPKARIFGLSTQPHVRVLSPTWWTRRTAIETAYAAAYDAVTH